MKLTYDTFKQGIDTLKYCYIDWSFNSDDEKMMATWYSRLMNMIPEQDFLNAVNYYTCVKDKGPNSPVALKKSYIDKYSSNIMNPIEALNALRELLKECEADEDDARIVASLTADDSYKALYITYINIRQLAYDGYTMYCNAKLNHKLEDSYMCTWFITEYKKNLSDVSEDVCKERITAIPAGSDIDLIGG